MQVPGISKDKYPYMHVHSYRCSNVHACLNHIRIHVHANQSLQLPICAYTVVYVIVDILYKHRLNYTSTYTCKSKHTYIYSAASMVQHTTSQLSTVQYSTVQRYRTIVQRIRLHRVSVAFKHAVLWFETCLPPYTYACSGLIISLCLHSVRTRATSQEIVKIFVHLESRNFSLLTCPSFGRDFSRLFPRAHVVFPVSSSMSPSAAIQSRSTRETHHSPNPSTLHTPYPRCQKYHPSHTNPKARNRKAEVITLIHK